MINRISVCREDLAAGLQHWGVSPDYARYFMQKMQPEGANRLALLPMAFNDTEHLTSQRDLLAANCALWIQAYREASSREAELESLASIRALFYVASSLGAGEIIALISAWWRETYAVHGYPAPNYTTAPQRITTH